MTDVDVRPEETPPAPGAGAYGADEAAVERAVELLRSADLGLIGDDPQRRELVALLRSVAGVPGGAPPARAVPLEPDGLADPGALPEILDAWARATGARPDAYRQDRRGFLRGDHLGRALSPRTLVRAAVARLRALGALPVDHRLSLVWTRDQPSATFPLRIPDRSAIALPDRPVALCAQYVHHELGHAMELAWRPPGLRLAERWRVAETVVEWVAMTVESLSLSPEWLVGLGADPETARRTVEHCRHEDRYTRALTALILRSPGAEEVRALTSGLVDPEHIREEAARSDYWRTVAHGRQRADRTIGAFTARWGERWWDRPESWRQLRADVAAHGTREPREEDR
ncbi:hypothetical protein ACWDYJ_07760 [Streptomyces sp. NPDC003042]